MLKRGRKLPLNKKRVKEALAQTHGYYAQAAKLLSRSRQTITTYIKKNPDVERFVDNLQQERGDQYEHTLHKCALGEVAYEKEIKDKNGNVTIVYYRQAPHFPSLKLGMELSGRYIPNKNLNIHGDIDLGTFLNRINAESKNEHT